MPPPPPPGRPAPIHEAPADTTCAVARLDGILDALQRHRQELVDLEHLEVSGLVPTPSRDIRASIEHRIRAQIAALDEWTAQE